MCTAPRHVYRPLPCVPPTAISARVALIGSQSACSPPAPSSPVFRDAALFVWLEENMDRLLARDVEATAYAIERSCINKVGGGGKGGRAWNKRGGRGQRALAIECTCKGGGTGRTVLGFVLHWTPHPGSLVCTMRYGFLNLLQPWELLLVIPKTTPALQNSHFLRRKWSLQTSWS